MSQYCCEMCNEEQVEVFYEPDVRPYFIFCSQSCINKHLIDIEEGEWDNYEGGNLGLEYANEIKNNWKNLHIQKHIQEQVSDDN